MVPRFAPRNPKPVSSPVVPDPITSAQARKLLIIAALSAGVLYGFYKLARVGPAAVETPLVDSNEMLRLKDAANRAADAWKAASDRIAGTRSTPTEADLKRLDELVAAVDALENRSQPKERQLPALRQLHHNLRGAALRKQSLALEREGLALDQAGDKPKAADAYNRAYLLEKRIDEEFPLADVRKEGRTAKLEIRVRHTSAIPLWEKSRAAEEDGDRFTEAKRPAEAATAYAEALTIQTLLDRDFRGLTPADYVRTRRLDRKLANARATPLSRRVDELVVLAEIAAAASTHDKLPALRAEFDTALAEIATRYPDAVYAEPTATESLRRRMVEAAITPHTVKLRADLVIMDKELAAGELTKALATAEALRTEAARLRPLFPGAKVLGPELDERLGFILGNRAALPEIHALVNAALRPAPGSPGLSVAATETSQRLYTRVMGGESPAAVRGDDRPVESITRDEARAFCQKLGWAIGRPVRLPTALEFNRLATESRGDRATFGQRARAIDNGDGGATAEGAAEGSPAGLRNVLGNVAEWLEPESDSDTGRIAGGDAEATLDELYAAPLAQHPHNRRTRFVGFRFVVPASTPAP